MKKLSKVVVLLVVALFMMTPAFAADNQSDNMQILRDKINADKKLVVATNMELTESEATAFWPVYEAYQKDLDKINKRVAAMIMTYAEAFNKNSMNNQKAKKMTQDFLSVQTSELNLLKSYVPKLSKVLPATKVARYLQIENKIRAVIRYEAAAEIPLI
jgi:hypothetical protein